MTKQSFCIAAIFVLAVSFTDGGELFLDFDDTPQFVLLGGNSRWRGEGGVANTGYWKVTDANDNERGAMLIGDLDYGGRVDGFVVSADLRIGNGTEQPADGLSFNFANFDDPAILNVIASASLGQLTNPTIAVAEFADTGLPQDVGGFPEEGTTTGIAIGIDQSPSGNHLSDGAPGISYKRPEEVALLRLRISATQ